MKRGIIILLWLMSLGATLQLSAQMYDQAFGLRGGTSATLSYKNFLGREVALEAIVGSFDYDFFGASILFQKYTDANLGRLQWYWGLGPYFEFRSEKTGFGGMGALGAEYSFSSIPIGISVDWTPRLRLAGGGSGNLVTRSAGVGLRYIISYY